METYRGTVYPYQLDHMGHMNVQWYVAKFDEGTWHFFSALGITPDYIRDEDRGMAALEQVIRYKSEVMAGELLVIDTEILEMREKTVRFRHTMRRAGSGETVAETDLVAAHLDRIERKACPFPDHIRSAGEALIG